MYDQRAMPSSHTNTFQPPPSFARRPSPPHLLVMGAATPLKPLTPPSALQTPLLHKSSCIS